MSTTEQIKSIIKICSSYEDIVNALYEYIELKEKYNSLLGDLAKAQAERDILLERTLWIPIAERLPDELQEVLIWTGRGILLSCRIDGCWIATQGDDVEIDYDVTHWMPLPEIPEVTE